MNLILMILSTQWLWLIMLGPIYMHNGSPLKNWRIENACGFALLKFYQCISISTSPTASLLTAAAPLPFIFHILISLLLLLLLLLLILLLIWSYLQPLPTLHLLWVIHFVGALIPTMEPGLIKDIKMKSFTLQYLIPNYPIKMIISTLTNMNTTLQLWRKRLHN